MRNKENFLDDKNENKEERKGNTNIIGFNISIRVKEVKQRK